MQRVQPISKNPDLTPGLLVSVRSASEALLAIEGGADLIDIKEPAHGSLGRASAETIASIVSVVNRRRPVSAALGEWLDDSGIFPDSELTYVKWGLAGCQGRADWQSAMRGYLARTGAPRVVLTAYADWECAQAPPVDAVFELAAEYPGSVLLIDTHCKVATRTHLHRPTLLDWLPVAWIEDLVGHCRDARVRIALAGSLGIAEIRALHHARPDWFAVRGAICGESDRNGAIDAHKVSEMRRLIRSSDLAATSVD